MTRGGGWVKMANTYPSYFVSGTIVWDYCKHFACINLFNLHNISHEAATAPTPTLQMRKTKAQRN